MQWHLVKLMLTNFRWVKFIEFVSGFVFFEPREECTKGYSGPFVFICSESQSITAGIRTQVT